METTRASTAPVRPSGAIDPASVELPPTHVVEIAVEVARAADAPA
ncbi:hypothetical protein OSC27_10540 [Microbacterium sp. STN6]|nr:hypothetical protein [Microbacterium sp. STN6]MCX7522714.1 hypothetical protein [Microbacterium sp. STN6]